MTPRPAVPSNCTVRPAEVADLPAVLDIYNDAVLHSTATFDVEPRSLEEQQRWFREHSHPYAVLVAVRGGELLGWASLSPFRPKPAYRFTAEDSVYVRADRRGNRVGTRLLTRLLGAAAANGFHSVIALVVGDNPASLRLHRRLGFRRVGVEREVGRKFDRWLDVVVMQKMLAGKGRATKRFPPAPAQPACGPL